MRAVLSKCDLHLGCVAVAQVLVVAAGLCWGLTSEAQQVIVMGTQYYDAGAGGARDYPVTHLLQMIGRAVRAKDQSGRFGPFSVMLISTLCHSCTPFCCNKESWVCMKWLYSTAGVVSTLRMRAVNPFLSVG